MINWGKIISQIFPLFILLIIGSVIIEILKPKKRKYYKKNKKEEEIIKFSIIGFLLFLILIIYSKTFRILLPIIILIIITITIWIKINKKTNNNKENYIITNNNNNNNDNDNDNDNFEIKFETNLNNKPKKTNKEKGEEYEKFVGNYFENLGYIIKYNGIEKGKKDNSIDLIAIKNNEIILIQCKNWNKNSKYKITHKDIKAFIGDTYTFINENPQYKKYNIKRLFVISNKILDQSAINYIKEHKNIIKYLLLKYK